MIIRGGENIQPTEIENYFHSHPGIEDIYVIGVPSKRLGEEVAAYISVPVIFDSIYYFQQLGDDQGWPFKVNW